MMHLPVVDQVFVDFVAQNENVSVLYNGRKRVNIFLLQYGSSRIMRRIQYDHPGSAG